MTRPLLFKILAIAGLILIAIIFLWIFRSPFAGKSGSIDPRGGTSMERFHMKAPPIYLQTDKRWSENRLGGSGERFGSVGCVVCCVSMALAELGVEIPPDELNRKLDSAGGFTEQGLLKWEAVSKITNSQISVDVRDAPDHATIDKALRQGWPVLAKVLIRGTVAHWVLIVGKDGLDYLIKDPLGNGTDLGLLADYDSDIHSVRVIVNNYGL